MCYYELLNNRSKAIRHIALARILKVDYIRLLNIFEISEKL
jgi:hypothetical protein